MLMRQTLVAAKFDIVYKYLDDVSSRVKSGVRGSGVLIAD